MRTATITFHRAKSFGAVLQAYSLQYFLIDLGIDNLIIDYSKNRESVFSLYSASKTPKALLSNLDVLLHKSKIELGNRRFETFIDEKMSKTMPYNSIEELQKKPPEAQIYISGSDQVWSVGRGVSPAYFLGFGEKEVKRISYSASMGNAYISKEQREKVGQYLSEFSGISVREESVRNFLQPLVNNNICVNIDPTFLTPVNEWRKLENRVEGIDKPYILCFCIYRPEWRNEELKKLHKRTGKDIVLIETSSLRRIYHNKQIRDAGPEQFLWLIDHADAVVTTSFHGVAFSAIFGKPLYAIVNPKSTERITNLLMKLGISEAIVTNLRKDPFDYDRKDVQKRIEQQIEKSREFILFHCRRGE